MLEDGPTTCERCGGELRRILYPTGIIFKGSGFYSTDARSGAANRGSAAAGQAAAASGSEGKAADNGTTPGGGGEAAPQPKTKPDGKGRTSPAGSSAGE
jgi:predicted nucleic acid-binding Zn ribbon protein